MSEPIGLIQRSIRLEKDADLPLFAQIVAALDRDIRSGALARGLRLPAERELAQALGINRATVGRAYRELEQRALVASRVGSGTTVVGGPDPAAERAAAPSLPAPDLRFSRGVREMARVVGDHGPAPRNAPVDFALMLPDVGLFPRKRLLAAVEVALGRGAEVLQYGSPAGLPSLREALARHISARGVPASPADVLVVNGIQQALDLLLKTLLDPGDAVVVESPTYANVLPLLKLYGARTLAIPLDEHGIEPKALERVLAAERPKLLYTIPSFHNPTGVTMSLERRAVVLELCRRHGVLVVEDGYEEELRWSGDPLPPLAGMPGAGPVVYLGTFSKGLFPGLRLGYMVARGELFSMLALCKRYSDYHADLLSQAVLSEILVRGDYDRHLERLRRTYGERMERTLAAIARHFPPGVQVRAPQGGYSAWVELPPGVRATAVADEALARGVAVLPGGPFFAEAGEGESRLRLSISRTDPERIEEGIETLGGVLEEAIARCSSAAERSEAPSFV